MPLGITNFLLVFFLLSSFICDAQEHLESEMLSRRPQASALRTAPLPTWQLLPQLNNWYFGRNAVLSFSKLGSKQVLPPNQIYTEEGCAVVNDSAGRLLFYSNGRFIWNSAGKQLSNGFGLWGHESSTQSCLVLPQPKQESIYYLFTVDATESPQKRGMRFSIVDMSKEKGLGEVTEKNVELWDGCTEKLSACLHADGESFWVCSYQTEKKQLVCFHLGSSGVRFPQVVSDASLTEEELKNLSYGNVGMLRFSPNGKWLAMAYHRKQVLIYAMDKSKGSLKRVAGSLAVEDAYGLEFSPSGNFLYVSTMSEKGRLLQVDISELEEKGDFSKAKVSALHQATHALGTLQFGMDGSIYLACYGQTYLSRILHPDLAGEDCGFEKEALPLANGKCLLGLPQFVYSVW